MTANAWIARCRVCGCTEDTPCPGGCAWVPDPDGWGDLCSTCAHTREPLARTEDGEVAWCRRTSCPSAESALMATAAEWEWPITMAEALAAAERLGLSVRLGAIRPASAHDVAAGIVHELGWWLPCALSEAGAVAVWELRRP